MDFYGVFSIVACIGIALGLGWTIGTQMLDMITDVVCSSAKSLLKKPAKDVDYIEAYIDFEIEGTREQAVDAANSKIPEGATKVTAEFKQPMLMMPWKVKITFVLPINSEFNKPKGK